ncbi:MAG: hypothetical protein AAGG75_14820 [Bacteroidota bacterium]
MNQEKFQSIGTLLALVISIIALFTSIYEANIMKSQQQALVWPYFEVVPSFSGEGFKFVAYNNGTGPAIIKSVEVRYKGHVIKSIDALLDAIKVDRVIGYDRLRISSLNNSVYKAGEERAILHMPWDEETREMAKDMGNVSIKVQYESVLGDFWLYDSEGKKHLKGEQFKSELEFEN